MFNHQPLNNSPLSDQPASGVTWAKRTGKWQARIRRGGKQTYLGYFSGDKQGEIDAAKAYDEALRSKNDDGLNRPTNFNPVGRKEESESEDEEESEEESEEDEHAKGDDPSQSRTSKYTSVRKQSHTHSKCQTHTTAHSHPISRSNY